MNKNFFVAACRNEIDIHHAKQTATNFVTTSQKFKADGIFDQRFVVNAAKISKHAEQTVVNAVELFATLDKFTRLYVEARDLDEEFINEL